MQVQYVKRQEELDVCVSELEQLSAVALDLEFDKNRFRYGFTLCLIQVAGRDKIYVIDPLENLELESFFRMLENPNQQIVVFEFGEDLRLLHSKNCKPNNIFDVSFASKLLNNSQISLATLAASEIGVELSKGAQKSNWTLRPLTEEQIKYAADDVRYLFDLQQILQRKAAESNIDDWVSQENMMFENSSQEEDDDVLFLKHKDKKDANQLQWFVLIELMKLRDEKAKLYNRPAFQILDKDFLVELSRNEQHIKLFFQSARPYKALNNEAFKTQLMQARTRFENEAKSLGLKASKPAIERLTPEELSEIRRKKNEEELLKERVFKPIQAVLKERFGENTASFMLSNKIMAELAQGNWNKFCRYRQDLIRGIASELNLKLMN